MPSNHCTNCTKSISLSSAMFFSSTLNHKLSFFSRAPLHVGQVANSIKPSAQRWMASDVLVANQRFTWFTMPSNSPLYTFKSTASSYCNSVPVVSSLPYNKKFSTFSGNSLIGLSRLNLYLRESVCTCRNVYASRSLPSGAMPPSLILRFSSGRMAFKFTVYTWPKPLQVGHAPYGELNENELGDGSSYDMPVSSHIKARE